MYSTLGTSQGVQRQKSKKVRVSKGPRLVHSFAVYLQTDALQFIPTLRFKEIGVLGTPGTQNHRSPFFQNTTEMICRKKKAQRRLELGRTCTSGTCSSAKKIFKFQIFCFGSFFIQELSASVQCTAHAQSTAHAAHAACEPPKVPSAIAPQTHLEEGSSVNFPYHRQPIGI